MFVDFLSGHIVKTGKYKVIDRMQRENILTELEFSLSGCADESCQLQIGRMLTAKQIIVGSLGRIGNTYILNIKLIEVETGLTIVTASEMYKTIDELVIDSENLVSILIGTEILAEKPEVQEKPAPEPEPEVEEEPAPVPEVKAEPKIDLPPASEEEKSELEPEPAPAETVEVQPVGEDAALTIPISRKTTGSDYSDTTPLLDIAVPGLSHFKAKNWLWGTVYLVSAVGGASLFGISEMLFVQNFDEYTQSSNTSLIPGLYESAETWRNRSIIGVVLWAGSAVISAVHAMVAK